jgi:hypothetical protein
VAVVLTMGALARSPVLRLVGGVAMAASGLFEASDTAIEIALGTDIRVWHGAVVFGVAEVVKSLGDAAEGARRARDARDRPPWPG